MIINHTFNKLVSLIMSHNLQSQAVEEIIECSKQEENVTDAHNVSIKVHHSCQSQNLIKALEMGKAECITSTRWNG